MYQWGLERHEGKVVAVIENGHRYAIGQRVFSNGRIFVPAGTGGTIVDILEPEIEHRTTNVFVVEFDGYRYPFEMKTKDFELPTLHNS